LAGALLFDEKIHQRGLDCGMMEFFTYELQSKEQLISIPQFWSTVRRKRSRFGHMQTMIGQAGGLEAFLHEATQNFEVVSNIKN
jgi:hypothetical protein